ncbi:hypothetical protein HK405_010073, partial [Cladochytrium tenue]
VLGTGEFAPAMRQQTTPPPTPPRAVTKKSHGCFLWMALAFEPLLHPGIGGGVVVVGDPVGGATVGGWLAAAVTATVAPVPSRPQVTFRSAVKLLHAFETFPKGLDAVYLGLLSYTFPVPAVLPLGRRLPPFCLCQVAAAQARLDYHDALLRRVLNLLACLREPVSISALANLLEEAPELDIHHTPFRLACFFEVQPTPCAVAPAAGAFVSAAADAVAIQLAHSEAVAVLVRCPDCHFRLDLMLAEADLAARCLSQLVRHLRPQPAQLGKPGSPAERDVCVDARVPEVLRYNAELSRVVLPTFVTAAAAAAADGGAADNLALPPALDDAAARALQDVVGLFSSKKLIE